MTTAIIEIPEIKYSLADEAIDALRAEYMPLEIASIDDKNGFNAVHDARMDVRDRRVAIENERKKLKEGVLAAGRAIDGEAKRLTDLLAPIEAHLKSEETRYQKWLDDRKREAQLAAQAKLQQRLDAIAALGGMRHPAVVEILTDEEFEATLADLRREKAEREEAERKAAEERKAEEERIAAERAELERQRREQEERLAEQRRIEEERLAKEREALEAERRKQAKEQAKLEAERKRLAEEEAERQRQAEIQRREAEAAERAKREAEERQQREQQERERKAAEEKAARELAERLRPDREKLLAVADAVEQIKMPIVVEREAIQAAAMIFELLQSTAATIRETAELIKKPAA